MFLFDLIFSVHFNAIVEIPVMVFSALFYLYWKKRRLDKQDIVVFSGDGDNLKKIGAFRLKDQRTPGLINLAWCVHRANRPYTIIRVRQDIGNIPTFTLGKETLDLDFWPQGAYRVAYLEKRKYQVPVEEYSAIKWYDFIIMVLVAGFAHGIAVIINFVLFSGWVNETVMP